MPNIEIHMAPVSDDDKTCGNGPEDVRERIRELIRSLPFAGDAVISICHTTCTEAVSGKPAPFLRIVSSNPDHFEPIRQALEPLGMDIETLSLSAFYLKGKLE